MPDRAGSRTPRAPRSGARGSRFCRASMITGARSALLALGKIGGTAHPWAGPIRHGTLGNLKRRPPGRRRNSVGVGLWAVERRRCWEPFRAPRRSAERLSPLARAGGIYRHCAGGGPSDVPGRGAVARVRHRPQRREGRRVRERKAAPAPERGSRIRQSAGFQMTAKTSSSSWPAARPRLA